MVDWAYWTYVNGAPEDEDCLMLYDIDAPHDPGAHLDCSSQSNYVHRNISGTKTCNKCKKNNLHWIQQSGQWKLAEFDGSTHECFESIKTHEPKVSWNENMTLRDYLAAKAMQGFLANSTWDDLVPDKIAEMSYEQADEMIKASKK